MDFPIETEWDEAPAAAAGDRQNVPEGEHEFRIKQVIEDAERLEIRLEHDERGYGWVFFRVSKRKPLDFQKRLISQLAASLAMTPEAWEAAEAGDLAGRRVKATIRHRDTGDKVFANVWGFAPVEQLEEKPAPKPPVKRTPSQKATATLAEPTDDIPFMWLLAFIAAAASQVIA
jgi:hypothetical protein